MSVKFRTLALSNLDIWINPVLHRNALQVCKLCFALLSVASVVFCQSGAQQHPATSIFGSSLALPKLLGTKLATTCNLFCPVDGRLCSQSCSTPYGFLLECGLLHRFACLWRRAWLPCSLMNLQAAVPSASC